MSCFKRVFAKLLLVLALPSAHAGLIDLGVADKYTMAVGQYDFFGMPVGGNLNLGSEAWIHGSVAASNYIGFGSGAIVYGDACSANITAGADVSGTASECSDVVKENSAVFDQLSLDIAQANEQAGALGGIDFGAINSSVAIQANAYDALAVSAIDLTSGEYLTINGSASDQLILNISGNAFVGSGAGILLTGGLTSANVFFNFINDGQTTFNFGGANISGTFLANNGAFIAGDGAQLDDVRFYTNNTLIANVQTVRTKTPVEVPEPSTILVFLIGISFLLVRANFKHS
ncbi:hypothetical protein tinsulaeT_17030 [Thalassotalea insulae]|uniref:Uncharacterized protein n=1 Tax=Thalassotalea insulae TaxID=2056778 RepID=A0ABQ6GQY0_9GAMM|nr:PEP-CTERM sorting domain-containing protein [Thalassotalea insulae]GLX78363.1 hypothetical protein tinsulaeT_17030 [Thalassotalea insulae]